MREGTFSRKSSLSALIASLADTPAAVAFQKALYKRLYEVLQAKAALG